MEREREGEVESHFCGLLISRISCNRRQHCSADDEYVLYMAVGLAEGQCLTASARWWVQSLLTANASLTRICAAEMAIRYAAPARAEKYMCVIVIR